jgi:hypothetical protein
MFDQTYTTMTDAIQRWLSDQLADIDSVRSAKIVPNEQDRLIVIHTWSGVVIHVHLLDQPTKSRTIKKIVQENTRVGIGPLFIVAASLVPPDGTREVVDEGLIALHALFRDKLYTYSVQDGEPRIGQVHFKVFNRGDDREVWYGPDIPVRHLPCFRVWVTAPQSIKGNWLIANFGSDAFWKQADYTTGRDAFRRQQRRAGGNTRFVDWSSSEFQEQGATMSTASALPESELDRAFKQLGLTREASGEEVKAAFRRLALDAHPDVSKLPKDQAEARFQAIYEAYSYIKASKGW